MTNANEHYGQFTGSEKLYKHFGGFVVSEGAKQVADDYGCYWFLDIIVSYHLHKKVRNEEFQVWTLKRIFDKKEPTNRFKVVCENGNGTVLVTQKIGFSDFKDDTLTLWCIDKTIMLPSEY